VCVGCSTECMQCVQDSFSATYSMFSVVAEDEDVYSSYLDRHDSGYGQVSECLGDNSRLLRSLKSHWPDFQFWTGAAGTT
jgi:hypothetical protein